MKIVYCGNFRHTFCTEVHVTRDAERIPGVEVVRVQEPQNATDAFLKTLEAAADGADLLIYQRTWGLPPEAIDLWRRLETRGTPTASYHLDLYVGLEREAGIDNDPFWRTGVVFSADGDPHTQEVLAAKGIDHRWMPAAIVSDEARVEMPAPNYRLPEVVFVGSPPSRYHPEWKWRAELLGALESRYAGRFERLPRNQPIRGDALSQLYQHVPVVVGDSLSLPGHRNYWSDRFYETVGRGGYLIGPNVPGIEAHFTSGEHLDLYEIGDVEHVFELVDQALADKEAVREIARRGQAHVRAHHTYRHRVAAMLASLGLEGTIG